MAIIQQGYVTNMGPTFLITGESRDRFTFILLQGSFQSDGKLILTVKSPLYATNFLGSDFPYSSERLDLGLYQTEFV